MRYIFIFLKKPSSQYFVSESVKKTEQEIRIDFISILFFNKVSIQYGKSQSYNRFVEEKQIKAFN